MVAQHTLSLLKTVLKSKNQLHLLDYALKTKSQSLIHSLLAISQSLSYPLPSTGATFPTLPPLDRLDTPTYIETFDAESAVREKEVFLIILAGGDGKRLGHDAPKGSFPLFEKQDGSISLFEIIIRKIQKLENQLSCSLPFGVLTSETNHEKTKEFFAKHNFFGALEKNVIFFTQKNSPLFDENKQWFYSTENSIATAPNGNGGLIDALLSSSFIQEHENYKHFCIIPIDNPLAEPYDLELIQHHLTTKTSVSFRCIKRDQGRVKLGLIGKDLFSHAIIDYTEFDKSDYLKQTSEGEFVFPFGSINLFCIERQFLLKQPPLPVHWVKKKYNKFFPEHRHSQTIEAWKGETFLSDIVIRAEKSAPLLSKSAECFFPIKTLDDIESFRQMLPSFRLNLGAKDQP